MSLFGFDQAPKIFIFAGPTDMRKGFDSLSGLVSSEMQMDPLSGYLFVFMNKNRNLIKILRWDSDGFSLFYKRLEKGSFQFANNAATGRRVLRFARGLSASERKRI